MDGRRRSEELRRADLLMQAGCCGDAVEIYEKVGQSYEAAGMAIKAIAVYKQVLMICEHKALSQVERQVRCMRALARLFEQIGLTADATEQNAAADRLDADREC